jgi:transcriptional regulator with XRE-family HTH domain
MTTKSGDKVSEKPLTPDLAEVLAQMDAAYRQASKGLPDLDKDWEFVLLGLCSEVVEQVEEALRTEGLSRAQLARRMKTSRANVSKLLNEAENFQMETIAKLAVALDRDIALRLIRKTEKVTVEPVRLPEDAAERLVTMFKASERTRWSFSGSYEAVFSTPSPCRIIGINDTKAA